MEDDSAENTPSSWSSWTIKRVVKWTFTGALVISGVAFLGYLVSKSYPRKQIEDKKPKKARCTCNEEVDIQIEDQDELDMEKQKAKNKLLEAESAPPVASPTNDSPASPSETLSSTPSEDKRFFDFLQLYASAGSSKPKRSRSFSSLPQLEENQRVNPPLSDQAPHSAAVTQSVPLQPRRLSQTPHLQQAAQLALQNSPPQPVTRPIARETVTYSSTQPYTTAHRRRTSEPAFCTADNPNAPIPLHHQHHSRTPSAPNGPTIQTQLPSSRFSSPIQTSSGPILSPSSRNPPALALQSPQSRTAPASGRYPPPSISTQSPRYVSRPGSHSNSPHPTHSPHLTTTHSLPPQHTSPSQLRHDVPTLPSRVPPVYDPSVQYDPRVGQQLSLPSRPRGDSLESKSRR